MLTQTHITRGAGDHKAPLPPSQSSPRKPFVSRFLLALAFFFLINLVVLCFIHTHSPKLAEAFNPAKSQNIKLVGTWPWWVSKAYLAQNQAPDIVLQGSSQMATAVFSADAQNLEQALDCVTYRRAYTLQNDLKQKLGKSYFIFNWSTGGAMASDAYMEARSLFQGKLKPKMVVIGVSPRDFMDNTLPSPSSTEPYRFFAQFTDTGALAKYAYADELSRLNAFINDNLPLCRLHDKFSMHAPANTSSEKSNKNHFLQGISASGDKVLPGQWRVPANIPYMFEDNTPEYLHRYANANPPIYKSELAFFDAYLKFLQAEHIKVLVVSMPSVWPNRKLLPDAFWADWKARVSGMCGKYEAKWLDLSASPEFVLDDYLDTVHLNARGGNKFFDQVSDYLAKAGTARAFLNK